MSQKCANNSDVFFYLCGELTVEAQRRSFTLVVKKTYELHLAENSGTLAPSYMFWYMCKLDKQLAAGFTTINTFCSTDGMV
jgi:hypothetical protein